MKKIAATAGMIIALFGARAFADGPPLADAAALPLATRRVPASADECAVWRRERSFAQSVERHDAAAFATHVHAGAVFNAGTADADRGRDEIAKSWAGIVEGKGMLLRWRPGIVTIGGDPRVAVSRGPYIVQTTKEGVATFSVGLYQTVWLRDPNDGVWRILFDGGASVPLKVVDRAAAETWVVAQAMSDCASGTAP
jgi:ketosteroid isomerase-like protein